MLNYIRSIVSIIFLSIPFLYILDFVFNILQIPFAMIHRYAAKCVFIYKMYILCQFYAMLTYVCVVNYDVNSVGLLVFESLFIWYVSGFMVRDIKRDDYETGSNLHTFVGIVSLCSIPALWVVYYFRINVLNHPVLWFFKIMEFMYNIPIIGKILSFFTSTTTGWVLILFAIIILMILFMLIQKTLLIFGCIRRKVHKTEKISSTSELIKLKCPYCNTELLDKGNFCYKCGGKLNTNLDEILNITKTL